MASMATPGLGLLSAIWLPLRPTAPPLITKSLSMLSALQEDEDEAEDNDAADDD